MSISVSCGKGDHDKCLRRSCGCYCGHAHLGTVAARDAVLADRPTESDPPPKLEPVKQTYKLIPIGNVRAGTNVRAAIVDLEQLTDSIRAFGILEPLIGCPAGDGDGVEILMGQRRLAAAIAAELTEVPVLIRPRPTERDRLIMQLAENLERAEMTPIEEARTLDALLGVGLTQQQAGRAANRSIYWANTRLQLLKMPRCLQEALHARTVTPTVALALPRALFLDKEAVARLKDQCGSNEALRKWAHDEATRSTGTLKVSYQIERGLQVPLEYYELAGRAAAKAGKSMREWVRDVVEAAALELGIKLPAHTKKIVTSGRRS